MLSNLFSGTSFILLIVVFILLFLLFFVKGEVGKKILLYGAGLIVIVTGIFACLDLSVYVNKKNQTTGSVVIAEQQNNVIYSYTLEELPLVQIDGSTLYYYEEELNAFEFNGKDKGYFLEVNDRPCSNIDCKSNYVSGTFLISFEENEVVIATVNLDIKIEFNTNFTSISITAEKVEDNLDYLMNYVYKNKFKISIVEFGV